MSSEVATPSTQRSARLDVAPPPSCSIGHTTGADGPVLVWVIGELDVWTAPDLRAILADLAEQRRATLLDLSATTFMDCAGLAVVLRATATSEREGWSFVIADRAPLAVTSLFDLARACQPTPAGVGT